MKGLKTKFLAAAVFWAAAGLRAEVTPAVAPQAEPFPLSQVRLLDGPFREAMVRDENYLLSLEPDRLLSGFRKEAGLPPKGAVYGGWESMSIAGHTLGHYLSACSHMYAATGDRRFRDRVEYIVGELAVCQQANGNGYVAAIPNGRKVFAAIAAGDIRARDFDLNGVWVPWYTLHKEFAGLIDACQLCGDPQALVVATNLANWAENTTKHLTDDQWQAMLVCEQGGMNEALANLYGLTGNPEYLALARKFYHRAVMDPLARGEDELNGLHSNMQIPKVIGVARLYELTGEKRYADIAGFFWRDVTRNRSFVIGGDGDREHFFPTNEFARHLAPETAETCCTYNLLKLTRHLFEWAPDAAEMDYYERALYNHILASQDPDSGMFVYFMSMEPGHFKTYSTPENSFWCCVGSGMENHAKYGDTIYFHDADSLWVNLFIASELEWPEKGLTVRQETSFPKAGSIRLRFQARQTVPLTLRVRHPYWATAGMNVKINGRKLKTASTPASYLAVTRDWHEGDTMEIELPMKVHAEFLPGTTNEVALLYGPLVLAGELGTNGMPNPEAADQTKYSRLPVPPVPVFAATASDLVKHVRRVRGEPLAFRTRGVGRPDDVTLIPYYQMHRQRYSVYWRLADPRSSDP